PLRARDQLHRNRQRPPRFPGTHLGQDRRVMEERMTTRTMPHGVRAELFGDLTETNAPSASQPLLAKARQIFGFVPNLAVTMAAVPAALESYFHNLQAFGETPLTPIEQQIVLMAVSRVNGAEYSLAIHAGL